MYIYINICTSDGWPVLLERWSSALVPMRSSGSGLFPQQRKLTGSSAQISSGVCRCGSEEQVPEATSGRFRRARESSSVSEGSAEFRCGLFLATLTGAAM